MASILRLAQLLLPLARLLSRFASRILGVVQPEKAAKTLESSGTDHFCAECGKAGTNCKCPSV